MNDLQNAFSIGMAIIVATVCLVLLIYLKQIRENGDG